MRVCERERERERESESECVRKDVCVCEYVYSSCSNVQSNKQRTNYLFAHMTVFIKDPTSIDYLYVFRFHLQFYIISFCR